MKMASDSNTSFHHGFFPSSSYNQHVVSFQSGDVNSTAGLNLNPRGMNSSGGIRSTTAMILAGNTNMMSSSSAMITVGGSSGNVLLDPVPGLKHNTGLAVDWSFEEMAILKSGLIRYVDEPNIMKYIKIAAMLRDKTVRDVALRHLWMTKENGKRRKTEEHCGGKKINDRKEKMVDYSSNANIQPIPPDTMAFYSFLMHRANPNNQFSCEVPVVDGVTQQLLDENSQVFSQITANLATLKIQDNIDLFCRTRNNIAVILNSMNKMPGIMCQMPLLPVEINEDLVTTILPSSSQALMFGAPGHIHMRQETRC